MIRGRQYRGFDFWDLVIGVFGWFVLWYLNDILALVGLRPDSSTEVSLSNALVILVVVGVVMVRRPAVSWFLQTRSAFGLSSLAPKSIYKKDLLLGLLMVAVSAVVVGLASSLGWGSTYTAGNLLDGSLLQVALAAILVATITPVVEELLFRGLLFGALQQTLRFRHTFLLSALISGILFALGHGLPDDPKFYASLATGIAAAYAYRRSDSLISPYIVHVVANGLGALLILLAVIGLAIAG